MNSQIELIIFDLDGTLVDSGDTIFKSTVKTLEILNIKSNLKKEELDKRIGAHFVDIFNELNIPVNDFEEFIAIYKKVYFDFIDDSFLYPGVSDTLAVLSKRFKIGLLTTKAQEQADLIIEHFNLTKHFDYIMGRRNGMAIKPAPEPLLHICKELNITPTNSMMVGDSELDIQCGKNASASTTAVTYGYRKAEDLLNENPDYIIGSMKALEDVVFRTVI